MNLEELRSARATERRKDSLQHLRDTFYDDVADYVAELREARDRRAAEVSDPFADEQIRRMTDEIETAEEVAAALYERRIGKVVKLASFEAADMPTEPDGMTDSERALYDDLVDRIERNKESVLGAFAGDTDPPDGTGSLAPDAAARTDPAPDAAARTDPAPDAAARTDPAPDAAQKGDHAAATSEATETTGNRNRSGAGNGNGTVETGEPGGALADAMGTDAGSTATPAADPSSDPEPTPDPDSHTEPNPDANDGSAPRPVDPAPAPPDGGPDRDGDSPSDGSQSDRNRDAGSDSRVDPGPGTDPGGRPEAAAAAPDNADRTTVRITRDVGAILGVDEREYDLATEDVVALPTANAEPLVDRGAAERLDGT